MRKNGLRAYSRTIWPHNAKRKKNIPARNRFLAIIAFRCIVITAPQSRVTESHPIEPFSRESVMIVRVIIEREVEPGQESKVRLLMTRTRTKAMKSKGYISGETLRALDNPNKFVVLSNWNNAEDWAAWEKDPERLKLHHELNSLLKCKEKCTVYTHL
jgi:heme-degrading monooxygenase HmoA